MPQNWVPRRWDECIGNEKLIQFFKEALRSILNGATSGPNALIVGPAGSGKSVTTKLFARSVMCVRTNPETLDPCGICANCKDDPKSHGCAGLFVSIDGADRNYIEIDCTSVTVPSFREQILDLRDYSGLRFIFLDEIHRLEVRTMDQMLLKPVSERGFMWVGSCISPHRLDPALVNRFEIIGTTLPTVEALGKWLARRCVNFDINVDEAATLLLLAERAEQNPRKALQVLARAAIRADRVLSAQTVNNFCFNFRG